MNLILSDFPLPELGQGPDTAVVDLSALNIHHCIGCFGCWVKTPGKCVIRDDAVKVYPLIAQSDRVIYVSRVKYGSYDSIMKTMLERAIPIQKAFIQLYRGETHHMQRAVKDKEAVIIAYGAQSPEEQAVFRKLIERNAYNMRFSSYQVLFTTKQQAAGLVKKEAAKWEKS